jgi:hypothetical protein
MKKTVLTLVISIVSFFAQAQLSKSEVEKMLTSVNFQEIKDIFLIRTREHDGSKQGWFEKFEKLDPKSVKIVYGENSMEMDGKSYVAFIPYDKIKLIFMKRSEHLTIELID